eukprot:7981543-Alexandrium_andersonii.AAC.1
MFTTSALARRRRAPSCPPKPHSHAWRRSRPRSCPPSPLPPTAVRLAERGPARPRPPPMAGAS